MAGFSALKKKTASKKPRSTTPEVQVDHLYDTLVAWRAADEAVKAATSEKTAQEGEFLGFAEDQRLALSQDARERVASVRLVAQGEAVKDETVAVVEFPDVPKGGRKEKIVCDLFGIDEVVGSPFEVRLVAKVKTSETAKVLVTSAEQFSALSEQDEPALRSVFGDEAFDGDSPLFEEEVSISVKAGADLDVLAKACEAAGIALEEFFERTSKTTVSKRFLEDSARLPGLSDKRQKAIEQGLLKPYKSRVRA